MELQRIFLETYSKIQWDDMSYQEYRLRSPEEVKDVGKAKCADAILYIKSVIERETNYKCLPIRVLIRSDRLIGRTRKDKWVHVLLVVYVNDATCKSPKLYLVEWRWCEILRGVIGPFETIVDLITFIEKVYASLLREKYHQLAVERKIRFFTDIEESSKYKVLVLENLDMLK